MQKEERQKAIDELNSNEELKLKYKQAATEEDKANLQRLQASHLGTPKS